MKRFLLTSFFITTVCFSFFTGKVFAAPAPIPEPGRIKCPDINGEDPNFNSSRPYQASPCGDSPKAVMCGNSLQVIEDTPSRRAPAGTQFLDVEIIMPQKQYAADVTGATFPIAGNTELTKNSQSTEDQIDDAIKVNEYLNWYLNGTTDRAENGVTDINKIVDYAGPVKKLLPGIIQDSQRLVTIKNLYKSADYATDEPQNPGDHPGPTELIHDEAITHDQIVVCTKNAVRIIPLWLSNLLDLPTLGVETPTDCYPNAGARASGSAFRLDMWSQPNEIGELVSKASQYLPRIFPGIISQLVADMSNHWPKRYPPLPWSDQDGQPFETYQDYQKAYNEWRGQLCTFIPNIFGGGKTLICAGAWPILTNPYADLYSYVPLSNTVDKNAKTPITGVGINGIGGTEVRLPGVAYEIMQEPVLFYPHTAEVSELSDTLNKTYIPKEGTTNEPPSKSTEPLNDPTTNKCRVVNLRSNPGDYLFPEVDPSEVRVEVKEYTVTRIPCHDVTVYNEKREVEITYAQCRGQVAIEIRMITKVPYAKEIYDSTTAGADSTFRKIYPKVEPGAPVTCISNIPSVTDVQYIPTENMDGMKVIGPLGDNTTDSPKLYFPHFGSVYDYFLKGIQTALRPKGYGEPTPESGTLCENSEESGDCSWNMQKINTGIRLAAVKYKVPESLLRAIFEIESYEWINGAETYQCTPNSAGALGVAQITQETYDSVTCNDEEMSDERMCGNYDPKLSRCNFEDAFELMARVLLLKAGLWNSVSCSASKGISESEVQTWYQAACNYYGTSEPDDLTIGLANDIPADQRRQNGAMNYCDIVGYKMGKFPPYP